MLKTTKLYKKTQLKLVSKKLKAVYYLIYYIHFSLQLLLVIICITRVLFLVELIFATIYWVQYGYLLLEAGCRSCLSATLFLSLESSPYILAIALAHYQFKELSNFIVELDKPKTPTCDCSNIDPIFFQWVAQHEDFDCSQVQFYTCEQSK